MVIELDGAEEFAVLDEQLDRRRRSLGSGNRALQVLVGIFAAVDREDLGAGRDAFVEQRRIPGDAFHFAVLPDDQADRVS